MLSPLEAISCHWQGDTMSDLDSFLRLPDVLRVTGMGRAQIHHLVNKGVFPAPIKLSPRITVWSAAEIAAWQRDKVASGERGFGRKPASLIRK
jgi:prophage regulatory protein